MDGMGCDIHMHIEVKVGRRWRHRASPHVTRNYTLFALLGRCGRDQHISPVADNRGMPRDASVESRWQWNKVKRTGDYHSPSWLSLQEVREAADRFKQIDGRDLWLYFDDFDHAEIDDADEDVRFVFWFDN